MPIQNRIAACDICGTEAIEPKQNAGWSGWAHIIGIGAQPPKPGDGLQSLNMETWLCPICADSVSKFIDAKQRSK